MNRRILRYLRFAVLGIVNHPRQPRRYRSGKGPARNWRYREWIRSMACAACLSTYRVEAAHTGSDGGTGLKSSDYSCIPLCRDCHTMTPESYHRHTGGRDGFENCWHIKIVEIVSRLNAEWCAGKVA